MATATPLIKTQPAAQQPMQTTTATQPTTQQTAVPATAPATAPQNKQLLVKPVVSAVKAAQEAERTAGAPKTPKMEFDADTMTVEGRLGGLLQSTNPIMQTAATKAKQEAAARGLQNSSLAVQAGQQAVIESALPIAQQDAQTAYDKSKTEYGLLGSRLLNRQQSRLEESRMRLGSTLQLAQIDAEQAHYMTRMNREIEARAAEQAKTLDAQAQQQYAQIQASTMDRISSELTAIYQNPEMSTAERQSAVNAVYSRWQKSVDFTAALFNVAATEVPSTTQPYAAPAAAPAAAAPGVTAESWANALRARYV